MGILKKLALVWKTMPTKEKIGLVIDVVSGAGCGIGSIIAGNKLSAGRGPIEKVCVKTACVGLGLAASDISSKALRDNYGNLLAGAIDKAKAKVNAEKAKEATANE